MNLRIDVQLIMIWIVLEIVLNLNQTAHATYLVKIPVSYLTRKLETFMVNGPEEETVMAVAGAA